MTRLLLVRHARPAADWDRGVDAPLDAMGREQAVEAAGRLRPRGPLVVATSPLRRARETAAPLAERWGTDALVVDAVGEVPSPTPDLVARGVWLRTVLAQTWRDVDAALHTWREQLLAGLASLGEDTVVFTHYVAINTAVGAATGDERLVCCTPGHASVTELDVERDGTLSLVSLAGTGPQVDSPS